MKTTSSHLHLVSSFLFLLAIFPHPILSRKGPQPFEFLQFLKGSQKGQTVKGLNELKQYLKNFGYLNVKGRLTEQENDHDEFDEMLESGIKTYQLNYRLEVTGKLDAQTVKKMMMPRCGFPDVQNGATSMESGKIKNHRQSSSLHTVAHYTFFPGNKTWPPSKTHLTYRFSSSAQATVDNQTLRSACSRAFATWAAVSKFTFLEAAPTSGLQADIVIGFHKGDHGDGNPFDGPGGVLAHSFAPTDGRFHLDADENWSSDPGSDMYDLETSALHEIGHLLGLGHSSVTNSIMYPAFKAGVKRRELEEDDIQGIRALYPGAGVECSCKFDDIAREWSYEI